jgi:hypothetical protein
MTEFPRLLHTGSPKQQVLLHSACDDAPSASSQMRLLLALGVGGAALSIASSAQAATNVGTASSPTASVALSIPTASGIAESAASAGAPSMAAPVASAVAVPGTATTAAFVAKWLLIASSSLTAIGIGVVVGRGIAHNTPPWQVATVHENAPSAELAALSLDVSRAATQGPARSDSATPTAPTLPLPPPNNDLDLTETPVANHSASPRPKSSGVEPLTVSGETALVEKAREALRHGDPVSCLSLLEIRRKGVRGGVLAPEATILRIESLRALGQRALAKQEAARFVHDYPNSPLIERIRGLLEPSAP